MDVVKCLGYSIAFADEAFHMVCVFDVLEHIADEQLAVQELYRHS